LGAIGLLRQIPFKIRILKNRAATKRRQNRITALKSLTAL